MPFLPFHELTNSYDNIVWSLLVISSIVLATVSLLLGKSAVIGFCSFWRSLERIYRIILGLDLCIRKRVMRMESFRILLGGYMLAMLVINNAYKNDNVYRFVQPRQALRFQRFEQLQQYNFTMYSKLMFFYLVVENYRKALKSRDLQVNTNHKVVLWDFDYCIVLRSGIGLGAMYKKDVTKLDRLLFNESRLHPVTVNRLIDPNLYKNFIKNTKVATKQQIARKWDRENILKSFRSCKKVAIFMAAYEVEEFVKSSIKQGEKYEMYVDVSKIGYYPTNHAFALHNILPPFIVTRMKAMHEAHSPFFSGDRYILIEIFGWGDVKSIEFLIDQQCPAIFSLYLFYCLEA